MIAGAQHLVIYHFSTLIPFGAWQFAIVFLVFLWLGWCLVAAFQFVVVAVIWWFVFVLFNCFSLAPIPSPFFQRNEAKCLGNSVMLFILHTISCAFFSSHRDCYLVCVSVCWAMHAPRYFLLLNIFLVYNIFIWFIGLLLFWRWMTLLLLFCCPRWHCVFFQLTEAAGAQCSTAFVLESDTQ